MKRILYIIGLLVLGAAAVYLFFFKNRYSSIAGPQSDFAIEDTASVGSIMIANTNGDKVVLKRQGNGNWLVNDKYLAREDAIETILKTFKLIYVRQPVSKSSKEDVIRIMASSHQKVEVYDRKGNWIKTYYVGMTTRDEQGTYMLLENKNGRSSAPFITTMKGFRGTLNTRFFTNIREWRSPRALKFPGMNIQRVSVDYPATPSQSFIIEYGGGNELSLISKATDRPVENFDTLFVKDYLLNFKKAYFEVFEPYISEAKEDSILNSQAYQHLEVTDKQGKATNVWLYHMDNSGNKTTSEGKWTPYDPEYLYGSLDNKELAKAQRRIWDAFRVPLKILAKGHQDRATGNGQD